MGSSSIEITEELKMMGLLMIEYHDYQQILYRVVHKVNVFIEQIQMSDHMHTLQVIVHPNFNSKVLIQLGFVFLNFKPFICHIIMLLRLACKKWSDLDSWHSRVHSYEYKEIHFFYNQQQLLDPLPISWPQMAHQCQCRRLNVLQFCIINSFRCSLHPERDPEY